MTNKPKCPACGGVHPHYPALVCDECSTLWAFSGAGTLEEWTADQQMQRENLYNSEHTAPEGN